MISEDEYEKLEYWLTWRLREGSKGARRRGKGCGRSDQEGEGVDGLVKMNVKSWYTGSCGS